MKSIFRVLGVSAIFTAAAWAQAPNPNANPNPNPALSSTPAGRAVQERRGTNVPVNASGEAMTPEMREKLRATQQKFAEEQKKIQERLTPARAELNAAIQTENFDENTVRQKAAALAQIEADQAVLRARQYHEMREILPKRATNGPSLSPGPTNKKAAKTTGASTNIKSKSATAPGTSKE
jgi:Spy/CpxP family protein refolding chaperone